MVEYKLSMSKTEEKGYQITGYIPKRKKTINETGKLNKIAFNPKNVKESISKQQNRNKKYSNNFRKVSVSAGSIEELALKLRPKYHQLINGYNEGPKIENNDNIPPEKVRFLEKLCQKNQY